MCEIDLAVINALGTRLGNDATANQIAFEIRSGSRLGFTTSRDVLHRLRQLVVSGHVLQPKTLCGMTYWSLSERGLELCS